MTNNTLPYEALLDKYKGKGSASDKGFLKKYALNSENAVDDFSTFEDKFALWLAYYREFPHVFIKDYFGIELKPFQVYLLYSFFRSPNSFFVGCRGISKTFTTALFLLTYAILYSGARITVVSGIKEQAYQILVKIKEIRRMMPIDILDFEIKEFRESLNTNQDNVELSSGSAIKIVASSSGARGQRCSILCVDESAIVDKEIHDAVLVPMGTIGRQAPYMQKPEYAHLIERSKAIYLTSARTQNNWNYGLYRTYYENMKRFGVKSKFNLICLPYQVSVENGLVSKEKLIEQMRDEGFSLDTFNMEMCALWSKTVQDGYYSMNKLAACRNLAQIEYPKYLQYEIASKIYEDVPRRKGEIRVVGADIALMASNSKVINDNTVITYVKAYPNKTGTHYIREVHHIETIAGGVSIDTHALRIREIFNEFNCDYMVLDTNGIGMSIYSLLTRSGVHPSTGEFMVGYSCMNDENMAALAQDQDAEKVIYSIKASSELNKIINTDLQTRIIRGHLKLPITKRQADDIFSDNEKYPKWITSDNAIYKKIMQPYMETDKLIDEMIGLKLVDAEKVKLVESSGKRKDRFSSLAYSNHFITEQEKKLLKSPRSWDEYRVASRGSRYKQA